MTMPAEAPAVRFRRSGGGRGGYNELLEIDSDGAFAMDRRYAGQRAGSFAGRLIGADSDRLRGLMDAALAEAEPQPEDAAATPAGAPPPAVRPESSNDRIELGERARSFDLYDDPDGPWGELLALLRDLLHSLVDQPRAALELAVDDVAPAAKLRHVGIDSVELAGEPIEARATLMDRQSATRGSWDAQVEVAAGPVGPGWELDLGLDSSAFELEPGTGYVVSLAVPVLTGGKRTWRLHAGAGEGWER